MGKLPEKINKSKADWKKELEPEVYRITREKGTEPAFSGKYNQHDEKGIYHCRCCGNSLFSSESKYDSGSGWPSFNSAISKEAVKYHLDRRMGMIRTEVCCAACDAHLGHVFDDGPKPEGLRYCLNSASLSFKKTT